MKTILKTASFLLLLALASMACDNAAMLEESLLDTAGSTTEETRAISNYIYFPFTYDDGGDFKGYTSYGETVPPALAGGPVYWGNNSPSEGSLVFNKGLYLTMPLNYISPLYLGGYNFSVSFWVKARPGSFHEILRNGMGTPFQVGIDTYGNLFMLAGSQMFMTSGKNIANDSWHEVTIEAFRTLTENSTAIYIDGYKMNSYSAAIPTSTYINLKGMYISKGSYSGTRLQGELANLLITKSSTADFVYPADYASMIDMGFRTHGISFKEGSTSVSRENNYYARYGSFIQSSTKTIKIGWGSASELQYYIHDGRKGIVPGEHLYSFTGTTEITLPKGHYLIEITQDSMDTTWFRIC